MSRLLSRGTERVRNNAQDQDQDQVLNTHLGRPMSPFVFGWLFKK
jgi:hypothetical protein